MKTRPNPVSLIAWAYILAGSVGLVYHASDLDRLVPPDPDVVWVLFVRSLAIVGGFYALRRAAWSRWLLIGWIAYHVVLSFWHSPGEVVAHLVLCILFSYFLLRNEADAYFKRTGPSSP